MRPWVMRWRTVQALALLLLARAMVRCLRFAVWRDRLGLPGVADAVQEQLAQRLGRHVERAAARLPGTSKCLPQAMALSWMLRSRRIPHHLELMIRPQQARGGVDDLHAMVRCNRRIVLGNLPGSWIEMLVLPFTAG